jgi:hypothetical protein
MNVTEVNGMAQIKNATEYLYFSDAGEHPKCCLCGERRANGLWQGSTLLLICRWCAIDTLPQLMADAFVDACHEGRPLHKELHDAVEHINKKFYQAVAKAMCRSERREDQDEQDEIFRELKARKIR